MKKLCSLLLVLVMCISLAACGEDDSYGDVNSNDGVENSNNDGVSFDGPTDEQLQTLTDAYNQVAILYNDVATKAQANGWMADEEVNAEIQSISDTLEPIGEALTGDLSALNGANFDELPNDVLELLPALEELDKKVANSYEGGASIEGVVTDEALKPLADIYNELLPVYNDVYETAETNGWLADEQTAAELTAAYALLTYVGSGLTDDPGKLDDTDIDALVEQLKQFGPALEQIGQRVSEPFGIG